MKCMDKGSCCQGVRRVSKIDSRTKKALVIGKTRAQSALGGLGSSMRLGSFSLRQQGQKVYAMKDLRRILANE